MYFRLMVSNPTLLFQILTFLVECLLKAYTESMLELWYSEEKKMSAKEWLNSKWYFLK